MPEKGDADKPELVIFIDEAHLVFNQASKALLDEKGIPTPLAATMIRTPESRMDILNPDEIASINRSSDLVKKYSQIIDRESAYEVLNNKINTIQQERVDETARKEREKGRGGDYKRPTYQPSGRTSSARPAVSPVVKVLTSATFIRGVMGILRKVI